MCYFQGLLLAHDNINFDVVFFTRSVCSSLRLVRSERLTLYGAYTHSIYFLDPRIMRHSHINKLIQELIWCRLSNQQPHMLKCCGSPGEQNQTSDGNCASGIEEPHIGVLCSDDRHNQTKGIDDDIVSMIQRKDSSCRVATQQKAVYKEYTFGEDGDTDADQWYDMEDSIGGWSIAQSSCRFDDELHGDRCHQSAE